MVNAIPDGGGGGGLGPRQKHPASPGDIRARATTLVTQSSKAIDQKAITDRAFNPATDNWDGIAAPELRTAPEPVRRSAHDLSAKLAWAAVPLNFWAHQVEAFNAAVDKIEAGLSTAADSHYGAKGTDGKPPTDAQINTAKSAATSDANTKWYAAYNDFIVSGASKTTAMFNDGPTDANVALAKSVGAIPTVPGVFTVYTAEWHQTEMETKARQAAALAKKINQPGYHPSKVDLEQLNALLKNQKDPAFAAKFLNELGPKGLLQLTINVADFQGDIGHKGGPKAPDDSLATLVASVQSGLGAVLAVGTRKVGTRNQVSAQWLGELVKAGGERMNSTVAVDPRFANAGTDLYGYQAIGVLLSTKNPDAKFSSMVLDTVGDGMIQFERDHGGSKVWDISRPHGAVDAGYRLNWINGYDQGDQAGFDPVTGLMTALKNDDPETSKHWFTHQWESGTDGGHLSMVKYLLTERDWPADRMNATEDLAWQTTHDNPMSNGLNVLGEALDHAATGGKHDAQAASLTESVVYELGHHQKSNGPVVPLVMKDSVAHIVAYNVDGVYASINNDHSTAGNGDQDQWMPGIQTDIPRFAQHELLNVMNDLGKDTQAYNTVHNSAVAYAAVGYGHALHGHAGDATTVSNGLGTVSAYLDHGYNEAKHDQYSKDDAHWNQKIDNGKKVVDFIAGKAIEKVPYGGPVIKIAYGEIANAVAKDLHHDSTSQANWEAGDRQIAGAQKAQDTFSAAAYQSTGNLTDSRFYADGHRIAYGSKEWQDRDLDDAWNDYLKTHGHSGTRTAAGDAYESAYQNAKTVLGR